MQTKGSLVPRNIILLVVGWILVPVLAIFAYAANIVTVEFQKNFVDFGIDSTDLMTLFVTWRYLWWLFPSIALVLVLFVQSRDHHPEGHQTRYSIGLVGLFLLTILLVMTLVFVINGPIFAMGSEV